MKKRDFIWLAVVFAVAVIALLFLFPRKKPFIYQGKNSWQWACDLQSPVPGARDKAIAALNEMGTNAVPLLVKQLEFKEPFTRKARIWLGSHLSGRLGTMFSRDLKPLILADIHWVAARGLQQVGTNAAAATPALLHAMQSDPEAQVVWDSAGTLAAIGAPAVPGLIKLLQDPTARVRHAAAYALGQIGPPALPAASALIRSATDSNADVRGSSFYALVRIGPMAANTALRMAREERGDLRRAAAKALVSTHPRTQLTLPVLAEMAGDPDPASRSVAIEAMWRLTISHTNAMAIYIAGLSDTNAIVRAAAARALDAAPSKSLSAIPALRELENNDPDEAVRKAAGETLEKIAALFPAVTNNVSP